MFENELSIYSDQKVIEHVLSKDLYTQRRLSSHILRHKVASTAHLSEQEQYAITWLTNQHIIQSLSPEVLQGLASKLKIEQPNH